MKLLIDAGAPSSSVLTLIVVGSVSAELVVDRVNNSDTLEVKVEMTEEIFAQTDSLGEMQRLQKYIQSQIKSVVGIQTKVTITAPKSLPRSEGKAKRVIDNRKL